MKSDSEEEYEIEERRTESKNGSRRTKWPSHLLIPPLLALYLYLYEDTNAVLEYLRKHYDKSKNTYLSTIRRLWCQLNACHHQYNANFERLKRQWDTLISEAEEDVDKFGKYEDSGDATPPHRWNTGAMDKKGIRALKVHVHNTLEDFRALEFVRQYTIQTRLRQWRTSPGQYSGSPVVDYLLSKIDIYPRYYFALKTLPKEQKEMKEKAYQSLKDKGENAFTFSGPEMLSWAREVVENPRGYRWNELAAALAFLTGRRMVEIFVLGTMEKHEESNYLATFRGQAKVHKHLGTKGRGVTLVGETQEAQTTDSGDPYVIPLLHDIGTIGKALKYLRELKPVTKDMTNADVNNRFARSCNNFTQMKWGKDVNFHRLRAFYACVSYEVFAPWKYGVKISFSKWTTKMLGHTKLETAQHYENNKVLEMTERERLSENISAGCRWID
jgi:hypothetical protein